MFSLQRVNHLFLFFFQGQSTVVWQLANLADSSKCEETNHLIVQKKKKKKFQMTENKI